MKQTLLTGAMALMLAGSVYMNVSAQSEPTGSRVVGMTGNDKATWILTDADDLVYCWWKESPDRKDQPARCRVLNKWRVDRLQ